MIISICTEPLSPQKIYANNLQSVVELKAASEGVGESFGTAVFVDNDGTLVTNAHVVTYKQMSVLHTFDTYRIRFATEKDYLEAELVKFDEQLDLALLTVKDDCAFQPVSFGNSDGLHAGDAVYAVGNALNHGISIAQGIVSVPLLQIEYESTLRQVIQCDLTISEGNSGGALFNHRGKLVGVTTFRTKDNAGNVVYGVAYCIPAVVITDFLNAN